MFENRSVEEIFQSRTILDLLECFIIVQNVQVYIGTPAQAVRTYIEAGWHVVITFSDLNLFG